MLAGAPSLAEMHAPDSTSMDENSDQWLAAWRTQLAALRPDVRITP